MIARRWRCALLAALLLFGTAPSAQRPPGGPMRIVILVDSSTGIAPYITHFRAALQNFLDLMPGDPEMMLISTGGQMRIRTQPTTDRESLKEAVSVFASDGGGNAFLDSLLEADRRFLKPAKDKRPVFVMLMTDGGRTLGNQRIEEYNRFVQDFLNRGGRAHGIVIHGTNTGVTTDILSNFTENTNGFFDSLIIANGLPGRISALVDLVAVDQ